MVGEAANGGARGPVNVTVSGKRRSFLGVQVIKFTGSNVSFSINRMSWQTLEIKSQNLFNSSGGIQTWRGVDGAGTDIVYSCLCTEFSG